MILLLLRLLFVWFLVRGVLRLARGIAEGMRAPAEPKAPQAVPLVRDPVCGTFVVAASALRAESDGQTRYFCSENCRRTYARRDWNGVSGRASTNAR